MMVAAVVLILVAVVVAAVYRHQRLLQDRAQLMRDAMRHRDFSFHLPTRGLLFGERALQEALNDMGQDIEKLVAQNELESWQRLTRVLTHEIMNATTPILSISQSYLTNPRIKGTPYEEGIQAIHDTCMGLGAFADSYRKLTQLQEPVLTDVSLNTLCMSISALYPSLQWQVEIPADLSIRADEGLLRQVFINMVKNALEANARSIGVRYVAPPRTAKRGSAAFGKLQVSNDGHVIPDDVAREIFIPFFTTKPTGSGIGLSLSRQILMMQQLTLSLREHPISGYNVTFEIENTSLPFIRPVKT